MNLNPQKILAYQGDIMGHMRWDSDRLRSHLETWSSRLFYNQKKGGVSVATQWVKNPVQCQ